MNESTDYQQLLLDFVSRPQYQPLKLRGIAKGLGMKEQEKDLKRALKRLVKSKVLSYGPKHTILVSKERKQEASKSRAVHQPPASQSGTPKVASTVAGKRSERSNELLGVFRRNSAGFGFVTPQDSIATDRSDDIFIPKQKTLDAADRDLVRIRLARGHRGGRQTSGFDTQRTSGRIVEIIQRNTNRFVGVYEELRDMGIVYVDGGTFETGILVGDASAKNGRPGDKVVIEMVRFPSNHQEGEGVIVEVLGDRGKPGVDTTSIMRQFSLPEDFPAAVLEEARHQAAQFDDSKIPDGRTDFSKTVVVTIDPATARDFDDAISLQQMENGHWQLAVHIADVSHFVKQNSALDDEAFQRGTSVYLPDRVVPMLPEVISNNLASLQPHRLRYCLSAVIEFSAKGVPIHTELHRGVIQSAHRFTYEEIDQYLENDRPWKKKLSAPVFKLVRDMHTLAMMLRKRRLDRGAINLVLPEVRIDLDEQGKVCGGHTEENTESHQIIEEFMLAANIAVAQKLTDLGLNLLRRVHPQPSETKLSELTSFVNGLGMKVKNLQDRFELKKIIEQSEGRPEQHAIHYAVLRSMQKAVYSPEEIGHYALNEDNYCHFTSPIRRYPDLVIHRIVGDLIDGKKPDTSLGRLFPMGKHCSLCEKKAAEAERELVKLKLLNFMADKVGTSLHAVITGVEAFGVFAQGLEVPAEGLIPLANLPEDTYQYDRAARVLSGFKAKNQFRLGDSIEVKVVLVNPDRRILEFELLGVHPSPANVMRRGKRVERTTSEKPPRGRKPDREDREGKQRDKNKPSERSSRSSEKKSQLKPVSSKTARLSNSEPGKSKFGKSKPTTSKPTKSKPTTSKPTNSKSTGSKSTGSNPTGSKRVESQPASSKPARSNSKGEESGRGSEKRVEKRSERRGEKPGEKGGEKSRRTSGPPSKKNIRSAKSKPKRSGKRPK